MTGTDPTAFDPESTGAFRIPVQSLADALVQHNYAGELIIDERPAPAEPAWPGTAGPALVYVHTDGRCKTLIDEHPPVITDDGPDKNARELLVARALLVHALRLVDRELAK